MKTQTRILIVEDLPADAGLNMREAQKVIDNCEFEVVDTEKDFLKSISEFKPDLILSDYSMPEFDGLTALSLAIKHVPETPVIIVTGSVNEDTAVECMTNGAANYVIKQHIKRLGTAILHALEERKHKIEHRKAREALEESEKRYRSLFELSPVGILVVDNNGTILNVNETYCRISGYKVDELLAMRIQDLEANITPEKLAERRNAFDRNSSHIFETQLIHKSEKLIPVEISGSLVNFDGEPAIMIIMRDISERKFREKLQKMQYNIANAVINANSLHAMYEAVRDELSNIIDTTNFFVAFYNKETGMMQSPFEQELDIIEEWPADKSLSGLIVKQKKSLLLSRSQISEMAEKGIINLIGSRSEKWLGVPLYSGKQAIGAMVVQSYSNTNAYNEDSKYILELAAHELSNYLSRKETEQHAIKLSKAVEQNPVSIIITDNNGKIEYVNPKFIEVTGYSFTEAVGMRPSILKSGEQDNPFYEHLWNTITSGSDWHGEMKNKKKDGTYFWENAIISPIFDEKGVITNFVAVKEDITEKKNIIRELSIAKDKAEESDRLKTAFLQNISHEIRTPLNGILGFSELLIQDWTSPEERIEYNEAIRMSGKRLIEIISNVLDISIIETGQVLLNPDSFMLNPMMHELYSFYQTHALQKGLELKYDLGEDDENCLLIADQSRINQVIANLLNNAIKYTKKGEIIFGYKFIDGEVLFSVTDSGIGISKAHHSRIFTRFYQADSSSARNYEGAGLGLSISHGLVQAMGGKIWFESSPGLGSSFYFTIPINGSLKQSEVPIIEISVHQDNEVVLIADDDFTSFKLLETSLRKWNLTVIHAETGLEAVELVKNYDNIKLVLMDVKMPEMDGFEATRIIKSLKPGLPVIIQTAYAFADDTEKAFAFGCDDFLSKPIATDKLYLLFEKYLGRESLVSRAQKTK
ncbi:MAG: PAS domain S-box protein [Lentimicrobium sp.]